MGWTAYKKGIKIGQAIIEEWDHTHCDTIFLPDDYLIIDSKLKTSDN